MMTQTILKSLVYVVDCNRCVIYDNPWHASRRELLIDLGAISPKTKSIGPPQILKLDLPVKLMLGSDLATKAFRDFDLHPFPGRICRVCGCHQHAACWSEETGPCAWAESNLCTACVPQFDTKQKRLAAVVHRYRELHGKNAVTMDEVATWAIGTGLYPVPKRGCTIREALAWEEALRNA